MFRRALIRLLFGRSALVSAAVLPRALERQHEASAAPISDAWPAVMCGTPDGQDATVIHATVLPDGGVPIISGLEKGARLMHNHGASHVQISQVTIARTS